MTRHSDLVPLRDMLKYARMARHFAGGRTRQDLAQDEMFCLALMRAVEVVGEAARRVAPAFRTSHPEVLWSQIIATRNRLIHGYDIANLDILWDIATLDLPDLIRQLEDILSESVPGTGEEHPGGV